MPDFHSKRFQDFAFSDPRRKFGISLLLRASTSSFCSLADLLQTSYEGIKGDVPAYGAGAFSGFHHVEFW